MEQKYSTDPCLVFRALRMPCQEGIVARQSTHLGRNPKKSFGSVGEDGASPSRCRHCKRGVTLHKRPLSLDVKREAK